MRGEYCLLEIKAINLRNFGILNWWCLNREKLDERRVRFKFSGCYYFGENVITVETTLYVDYYCYWKFYILRIFFPGGWLSRSACSALFVLLASKSPKGNACNLIILLKFGYLRFWRWDIIGGSKLFWKKMFCEYWCGLLKKGTLVYVWILGISGSVGLPCTLCYWPVKY